MKTPFIYFSLISLFLCMTNTLHAQNTNRRGQQQKLHDFSKVNSGTYYVLLNVFNSEKNEVLRKISKYNSENSLQNFKIVDYKLDQSGRSFLSIKSFPDLSSAERYKQQILRSLPHLNTMAIFPISQYNMRVILSRRKTYQQYIEFYTLKI